MQHKCKLLKDRLWKVYLSLNSECAVRESWIRGFPTSAEGTVCFIINGTQAKIHALCGKSRKKRAALGMIPLEKAGKFW